MRNWAVVFVICIFIDFILIHTNKFLYTSTSEREPKKIYTFYYYSLPECDFHPFYFRSLMLLLACENAHRDKFYIFTVNHALVLREANNKKKDEKNLCIVYRKSEREKVWLRENGARRKSYKHTCMWALSSPHIIITV